MCWCVPAACECECEWGVCVCVQLYVDTGYGMYEHDHDYKKTGWNNDAIASSTIGPIHGLWGEIRGVTVGRGFSCS